MSRDSKVVELLKESLDKKVVSMSLDEYENMKGIIEDQKELIEKLRNEKEPIFSFNISVSTRDLPDHEVRRSYFAHLANQFGLGYDMLYARLKIEEVSDNPTFNAIQDMVDEKLRQIRSVEDSAMEMLAGMRRQREATEEALKRAPWWCRWAIKPNNHEKSTKNPEKIRADGSKEG